MTAAVLERGRAARPAPASRRTPGAGASGRGSAAPRSAPAAFAAAAERVAEAVEDGRARVRGGRADHPVRGRDRRLVRRLRRGRRRRRRRRGRARRPPRRDQRDPVDGDRADLGRPRPHAVARRDRARDRRREARGAARGHGARRRPALRPTIAELAAWTAAERDAAADPRRRRSTRRSLPGADGSRTCAATPPSPSRSRAPSPRRSSDAAIARRRSPPPALPGRAERIAGDPPLLADAAHNEQGALALAEALPGLTGGRPVFACLSVLADKDARRDRARRSRPRLDAAVCTAADPGPAMGRPGAGRPIPRDLAAALAAAGVDDRGRRRPRRRGRPRDRTRPRAAAGWRSAPGRITFCGTHGPRSALRTPLDDGPGRRRGGRRDPRLLRPRLPVRPPVPLGSGRTSACRSGTSGVQRPYMRLDCPLSPCPSPCSESKTARSTLPSTC